MDALKLISDSCLKADAPKVEIGDTVRVQVRRLDRKSVV